MANISNPLQISAVQDFRSVIGKHNDLAKAARFAVQITGIDSGRFPDLDHDMVFLCEAAEIPGRALNVDEVRYYGPAFKLPFQSAYTDVTFTFLIRNRMMEKEFFDDWIERINPRSSYDFNYRDSYASSINIWQFSEIATGDGKMEATYKATMQKAYPIFVAPMPVNWAEDNFHRLQVTFAYLHWTTGQDQPSGIGTILPQSNGQTFSRWAALPKFKL